MEGTQHTTTALIGKLQLFLYNFYYIFQHNQSTQLRLRQRPEGNRLYNKHYA